MDSRSSKQGAAQMFHCWVQVHQGDLLEHPELRKSGIGFDVGYNNHTSIALALTECGSKTG